MGTVRFAAIFARTRQLTAIDQLYRAALVTNQKACCVNCTSPFKTLKRLGAATF